MTELEKLRLEHQDLAEKRCVLESRIEMEMGKFNQAKANIQNLESEFSIAKHLEIEALSRVMQLKRKISEAEAKLKAGN